MQLLNIIDSSMNFSFTWPGGDVEQYDIAITYKSISNDGKHKIRLGFGYRGVYGKNRRRVVIWIDDHPYVEFFGADDFEITGEVLSEIRYYDEDADSVRMCRYAKDTVPQRYSLFRLDSLKRRVNGAGVHDAWCVVSNISDHLTMSLLASLRKYEREG